MPDGGTEFRSDHSSRRNAALSHDMRQAQLLHAASNHLAQTAPESSAKYGLSDAQRSGLWALAGALMVFLTLIPNALFLALTTIGAVLFTINIFLRFTAAFSVYLRNKRPPPMPAPAATTLPTFSILIPLYQEAEVVQQSVDAMAALDYPRNKLQIIYLLEADDRDTIAAFRKCSLDAEFEVVVLPHAEPRTKPRALNFGLGLATGDIITVYDAEDIPDPDQLKMTAARFENGDDDLAVVQAVLSPYNGADSWIASQFTQEYDILFRVWSPFITAMNWPLSLGGTSNHFRADSLRRAGGWDPYNVTEDADLGFRLATMGHSAAMIASMTHEEAPVRLDQWLAQRSRWIKGHMQTWMVLMRSPLRRMRQMGFSRFIGLQLTFTLSLFASFVHGPLAMWTIWRFIDPEGLQSLVFFGILASGYLSAAAAAFAGSRRDRRIVTLLTTPVYWPLQSLAALRALWEMRTDPYKWAKTQHGLSPPPEHIRDLSV